MKVRVTLDGETFDETILPRHKSIRCGSTPYADLRLPLQDGDVMTALLLHPHSGASFRLECFRDDVLLNGEPASADDAIVEARDVIAVDRVKLHFTSLPKTGATATMYGDTTTPPRALRLELKGGRTLTLDPEVHTIKAPLVIGRQPPADTKHPFVLRSDREASREHAHIYASGSSWIIQSLSKNGTRVHNLNIPYKQRCEIPSTGVNQQTVVHCGRHELSLTVVPEPWEFVPASDAMRAIYRRIDDELALTQATVIILGETGVGKTVLARRIHDRAVGRNTSPEAFVRYVHTPRTERSDLCGHVKGAFTGADTDRAGVFVEADGGTLFLDEIGDYGPDAQLALLRATDEGIVQPMGSSQDVHIDTRIIAATWIDLNDRQAQGTFRRDLYARLLAAAPIHIPPLRDRPEDILPYARAHLTKKHPAAVLDDGAAEVLQRHAWPANVRELTKTLDAACLHARRVASPLTGAIVHEAIRLNGHPMTVTVSGSRRPRPQQPSVRHHRTPPTREAIVTALRAANGNVRRAAMEILDIPNSTFRDHMRKLDIDPTDFQR